jgi:hypothetical protein
MLIYNLHVDSASTGESQHMIDTFCFAYLWTYVDYTGCAKLASFFHIALKNSSKDIFSIFFITKGTHLKLWFTSF